MNSEKNTRVEWIDFAKCIAIMLVIIGHVLSWYHPRYKAVYIVIYSMHMPFFFMLSGLTFRVNEEERVSDFIRYKAKKFFPPLYLFCVIDIAFQILSGKFNVSQSTKFIISSILFVNGGAFSKYWFLPALFVAEIILFLIFKLCKSPERRTFATIIIGMGGGTLSYFMNYHLPFHFESAVFAVQFIYCGILIKKALRKPVKIKTTICIALGVAFMITNIAMLPRYSITDDFFSMTFRNPMLFLITAFSGSISLLLICSIQNRKNFFTRIGRHTLYIYGFHYSILGILRKVDYKILHLQSYLPDLVLALIEVSVTLLVAYFCAELWIYFLNMRRQKLEIKT